MIKYEKIVYVIGNKKDLEKERTVSREEIDLLCKELDVKYIEASALSGENVDTIFKELSLNCFKYQ